jgi:hypothetical protein
MQKLPRQRRRTLAGPSDLLDAAPPGIVRRQVVEHHLAVTHDDAEQIVEIVGHPSGQASDRLHLLRLMQLPFKRFALGDVVQPDDGADPAPRAVGDRLAAGEQRAGPPLRRDDHHLEVADAVAPERSEQRDLILPHRRLAVGTEQPVVVGPALRRERLERHAVHLALPG